MGGEREPNGNSLEQSGHLFNATQGQREPRAGLFSTSELTPSEPIELSDGQLNPAYVEQAFQIVLDVLGERYQQHPARFPTRIQRLWEGFRGKETELVTLERLAKPFAEVNERHADDAARGAISTLNKLFDSLNLEIRVKHVSSYRISRHPKDSF